MRPQLTRDVRFHCTCEEFVAEVAGRRRKPFLDALKSTFKTIVLGKSTLVKDMSSFLREGEGALERKRVQELMSGWLNAYDFAAFLNPYLLPGQLMLDLRFQGSREKLG